MVDNLPVNLTKTNKESFFSLTKLVQQFLQLDNFQRAWSKVAEKQGCAGIDEETISDFSQRLNINISQLRDAVAESTYQPLPYKQVLIPKKKGGWRELKIPAVRDRIVQQALLNVLAPIMENKFSRVSFAYRPNISYLNAVEQVAVWRDLGYQWVLDADIAQYFDSIDHQMLLKAVRKHIDHPGILCLIKGWISVGISTETGIVKSEKGIPQGAVISPLLANIYLDEFDHIISVSDLKLVRYADDFLVFAKTQERIIQAYTQVEQILQSLELALHPEKTQITNFERGFRFLGHGFLENAIFPLESDKVESPTIPIERKNSKKKLQKKKYQQKINQYFPRDFL